ncbi:FtsX-like permease family protein [Paenibacillus sp. FSL P4-0338]|uniref:ABC transporter permease n=1 Tax=unclassified Paenibacillus TaxID=185978 RepID=UPI0003E2712D|nr:ABC transporter permease [Paenibacillus sp. FSL R7-269]ETT53093.1 ABC transporter permease [Paenibacillus sp. FSL R7-269]
MKLLFKLLRDIRQSPGQFFSFVLIVAVGAFFYTGLASLSNHLNDYTKAYFAEHALSDLNLYYSQLPPESITTLSQVEGIHKLEGRYTFNATESFDGYRSTLRIHSIPESNEINTLEMLEGGPPSGANEIVLDSRYAAEHGYGVGDQVTIRVQDQELTFRISGLGENVEHAKKNETQDHKHDGVAYVSEAAIPEVAGAFFYNELLVDAKEGYDVDQIGKSIEEKSKGLQYLGQESKERSFSYSRLKATLHNNGLMSKVIPLVLFLIEAIILFLAMSRIIDSQRNQVGIMKALGVSRSSIMLHYMGYPVLVGVAGSILGYILSAAVFVPLIAASNARSFTLPGIQFDLSVGLIFPPMLVSSLFGMFACYFSGRSLLKESASRAMRPKPPRSIQPILIERIPGLWGWLPYRYKLILRNIFLNKVKVLASSVGVMVSTVLLITAFGTQASLQKVAGQFRQVYSYDLRVDYKAGEAMAGQSLPSGIKSHYALSAFPIELSKNQQSEKAELRVTEPDNRLIHFYDDKDHRLQLEDHGVLVPQSYADHYSIAKGDTINIAFTAPELDNKTVEMKVLGISTQYSSPAFYITPDYLASFGIVYKPYALLVEADSPGALTGIRSGFGKDPRVEAISGKDELEKEGRYILQQNSFVFIMFIVCAVILSFGAIYTISSINMYERNRELATLKVLGYFRNQINRLIFMENIFITTVAVIVALSISGYVYELVVKALSSTHQQIPDQLGLASLLMSVAVAFALTLMANLLLRRKVTRINMIESLKGLE